ncbi:condensation domain-containing protein [Anaeromonas gelatinilytica]|uniref:condensation domain-containing protein n=1 Tax=Anaeromonas gelatinilytica TaxID=2683194 RepID=UPI0020784E02|nr:condensation domain-containing protein [Anaeromonas gelatinilytica]
MENKWRIILEDFLNILNQLDKNKKIQLPMKTYSYKYWSEQLQDYKKKNFEKEKDYWNSILNRDWVYPADFNNKQDNTKNISVLNSELDGTTTCDLIKKTNDIYSLEFKEVLIVALALTINNITNNHEVIIELEGHGREAIAENVDISRTVGWFTTIYLAYFKIEHTELDKNIKSLKEQIRDIPDKGFNYGILRFLNHEFKKSDRKYIRFNYLGDFDNIIDKEKLNVYNIEFGLDNDKRNSMSSLMDIEVMIVNRKLNISITYSNTRFKNETIQTFINKYMETLQLILDHCISKSFKEFTPSDFNTVDISQEDIDSLFN